MAIVLASLAFASRARAQACCAGSAVLTPGRLTVSEDALVGLQMRSSYAVGSFAADGRYVANPSGSGELDLEQDLFGAVRVLRRGQVALLVPLVETWRRARGASELGGGIGDMNVSARYDFALAGDYRHVPGIAVLAGLTLPTGRPPERASNALATDATGVGAFQGNVGLALEQSYGPWLLNLTALVAKRTARAVQGVDETLGTQLTLAGAAAHVFEGGAAVGALASYTLEGDATVNGAAVPGSSRRILLVGAIGLLPLSFAWRLQGSVFSNLPVTQLGSNLPATLGLTLAVVRSWS